MLLGEDSMTLSVKLIDSNVDISKQINKHLALEINKRIKSNGLKVQKLLQSTVKSWVLSSPEIQSLKSQGVQGSLNALFGLDKGSADTAIDAIASSVAGATQVSINKVSRNLKGQITFNFQRKSMDNLLSLLQGHQISQDGTDLHWLDWLLTKGDAIIIKGFSYEPSNDGRSGGGTMKVGGTFRVAPQYSGVQGNNFITRLLFGKEKQISTILNKLLV